MRSILSKKQALVLFICAFAVRALVMFFFIQPNGYYRQPDSMDYHNCTVGIALGNGMFRIDMDEPIFWRTPGYPPYLAAFYKMCGMHSVQFDNNWYAQCMALWIQIALASLIPIILFFLAHMLTQSNFIASFLAWIAVLHPGLVLASTMLLTEGLALIFFFLFLFFFYSLLMHPKNRFWFWYFILAIANLSIYTWMRPMGEFVGYASALLLFFAYQGALTQKLVRSLLFGLLFFATLVPWYYRNYQLTGEWFFCPTIGTYLNVFNAPKILRRTTGKPLIECHKIMGQRAAHEIIKKKQEIAGTGKYICNNICKKVSIPVCMSQPGYFIYDWFMESLKTTLDLYSYQLVTMANGSWWYDPIEEYLPEKIAACLYKERVPMATRAVCWLEFLFSIIVWIGLWGGLWLYLIRPLYTKKYNAHLVRLWLITIPIIALCIGMTGGFGYARLRLPVEPLMLILSLTFWHYILQRRNLYHEKN